MKSTSTSIRWSRRTMVGFLVLSLAAASCTGTSDTSGPDGANAGQAEQVLVTPNYNEPTVVVNVTLTDEGFEPSTIFIPAGRHIRLVLRNRGSHEHHFRVSGLIPAEMTWLLPAQVDEYDIDSMSEDELAVIGIDLSEDATDMEHLLHHLSPSFVPFKEESRSGIKPLPNEVHGYASRGGFDVMSFFAINTGVFISQDVRYPDLTGRVIVFEADGS
jgi:hypothetical protein